MLALTLVTVGISASKPPLWSMPTLFLSGPAAAAGIAAINSIGNLGGFVGPMMIGVIREQTGSYSWGPVFCRRIAGALGPRGRDSFCQSEQIADGRASTSSYSLTGEVTMRHYKIAAIPADGIGPEVISAGIEVLHALTRHDPQLKFDIETFDWGSDYYKKHGVMMPEEGLNMLKAFDAIYFGAVGAPDVPDHITLWGLRLPICQGFDQYANVRPTKILPGVTSPLRNRGRAILTGSSCVKTLKVNILVTAAVRTVVYLKKSVPKWQSLPVLG
ncbi:tartrate dehydrogenase [Klebsiella variicola]|uniref:Tartrate dehydrogenase n=1 Tax=Klebsiella variicola TaxID=244366 RepID=A0A7H4MI96_KLEVA|nr:tartrate dehydrogenase [Klebsiella variicola]